MTYQTDAYRDHDDNGPAPYRVRYLGGGDLICYLRNKEGKPRKFRSLASACEAARKFERESAGVL